MLQRHSRCTVASGLFSATENMNVIEKSNGDVEIKLTMDGGDVTLQWKYDPSGPDTAYSTTITVPGPSGETIAEIKKVGADADLRTDVPAGVYDSIYAVVHALRREIEMDVTDDDLAIIVSALVDAVQKTPTAPEYDYRDIARSSWVADLYRARPESGFPPLDPRHMSADDVHTLAAYLRADDDSLSEEDIEFSRGAADQIEALLLQARRIEA